MAPAEVSDAPMAALTARDIGRDGAALTAAPLAGSMGGAIVSKGAATACDVRRGRGAALTAAPLVGSTGGAIIAKGVETWTV